MRRLIASALMLAAGAALAQGMSPAGLWKTIDDDTGQAKSYVRISEAGGVLNGRIEKILDPSKQEARCEKCEGADKGQLLVGLTIVRGLKAGGDGWEGGEILDPNNGKVYKLKVKPVEGGAKLELRGYIGAPLFGRTQTWLRVE